MLRWLPPLLSVLALALIAFVGGAFVILSEVFPYPWLRDAYIGGRAVMEKRAQSFDQYQTDFWYPERIDAQGVTHLDPERIAPGYTLYTSGHKTAAFLIDEQGELVHEWHVPYSEVWDESASVDDPQPDQFIFWEKPVLFPNGDLIAIYAAAGDSPWGYGLVKVDKDSNVIWKYLAHAHHEVDVGEDGRVYVLTHEIRFNTYPHFGQLQVPRIDDFIVVLSPDGQEERKVPITDALVNSPYSRLLSRVAWYTKGDYLHTNAIEVIDGEKARQFEFGEEGQVLISMREIDTIAVVDLEQGEVVWALRGSWLAQHDPDILENGNILLFDNQGHYGPGGQSRIIEVDPATAEVVWSYAGTEEEPFDSAVRGAQDPLPNGNVLISDSVPGRLFEITREGEIVWDFINPVRATERQAEDGTPLVPIVWWAQRVAPDYLEPDVLATQQAAGG